MRILTLLAALGVQSALAAGPGDYAMVLPIETEGSSAAWQIELSTEVYHWSQDADLRDLAIFNAAGQPVPTTRWRVNPGSRIEEDKAELPIFALPTEASARLATDLQLIVERDPDGRVRRIETSESTSANSDPTVNQWLLDSSDFKNGIDSLTLSWSSPDSGVVARFDVDASNDLQTWKRLRSDATVALFERDGLRIERRRIDLDGQQFRYLRLHRLDNGPSLSDWRVEARRQQQRFESMPKPQWLDAELLDALDGEQASVSRHLYRLPAAIPASLLRIDLGNDNALAELDVFTPTAAAKDRTNWLPRAHLVAYRLRQAGVEIDNGDIGLAGSARIHELRIDSATPLQPSPQVRVGYMPDRLVFLAEGDGPYQLAVGSSQQRRPNYPIDAAISRLRKQFGATWQPPLARLDAARPSAGAKALLAPREPLAWKTWLLWLVLIGAAAVVGGIALSLLRGSREGSAEDRQQPPEE